jgi:hypothetical protein
MIVRELTLNKKYYYVFLNRNNAYDAMHNLLPKLSTGSIVEIVPKPLIANMQGNIHEIKECIEE